MKTERRYGTDPANNSTQADLYACVECQWLMGPHVGTGSIHIEQLPGLQPV